jgi:beta-glucosidase
MKPRDRQTPAFLWGTAGSAYQIEGGNIASDLWLLEHVQPTVFGTPCGDAADSFHRFEEDLSLAAALGLNCHRLSIEWSRVEPEPGVYSHAALAYYRRVLERCHHHGLAPVVTYNHFSIPRWLAARGGFEDAAAADHFVRYCEVVTRHLGDLIALAATFNEPNLSLALTWNLRHRQAQPVAAAMLDAAARRSGSARFSSFLGGDAHAMHAVLLCAHEQALQVIKQGPGDFPVGVTLAMMDEQPAGPDSGVERKLQQTWLPWLQAPGDFVGVQCYSRTVVGPDADLPPPPGSKLTQSGFEFWPQALEAVLRRAAALTSKPLYVTENGIATADDARRVDYLRQAIAGMKRCMADGIDVRGYMHWSLLDNWEFTAGFGPKFGLVSVDRATFARTAKPSARCFAEIVAGRDLTTTRTETSP